jgi:adenylylsulfate kinase
MSKCVWLTGLPSSGKTTIANRLKELIPNSVVLDGDTLRDTYLGQDVGFSKKDRFKHILRMGTIAKLFTDNGTYAICAFVSPDRKARDKVRELFKDGDYVEIFVDADVNECIKRDVKGMYARALRGDIDNFTGIDGPYDVPRVTELTVDTQLETVEESVQQIIEYIEHKEL